MPKAEKELIERDKTRDSGAELLEAVQQMKGGMAARATTVQLNTASDARMKVGLSQSQFASVLGVSVRTLQEWEQRRRAPSGAAQRPLNIAARHPDVLIEDSLRVNEYTRYQNRAAGFAPRYATVAITGLLADVDVFC
jgi:putative transcriptional regulator